MPLHRTDRGWKAAPTNLKEEATRKRLPAWDPRSLLEPLLLKKSSTAHSNSARASFTPWV